MNKLVDHNLTDEALFEQYKGGKIEAINAIIDRYKKPIYSFLLCKTKNKSEADDIFQDVFFKIIEKPQGFKESVSFKAWFFTLARNTYVDHLRKKIRAKPHVPLEMPDDEKKSLADTLPDDGPSLEQWVGGQKISEVVDALMGELSEEQRESFYLRVRQELTYDEIAKMMDCSVNTIKSRVRYALETIRSLLIKKGVVL